ncbi:hypothetical protein CGCA056_v005516 [Colletotrichum aenigma]|uniref:uncharacterized protein n=1 Tax=Colletotrichum aenigma TaxID=1215731 RepID=UPI0018732359|nr:uncharacterized protein CGCA056_v005516 [Colletotrichum aenigma]KAF5523290.1 hypothetical protein CGCA056_v005516 [Colletotrichum aenigma]
MLTDTSRATSTGPALSQQPSALGSSSGLLPSPFTSRSNVPASPNPPQFSTTSSNSVPLPSESAATVQPLIFLVVPGPTLVKRSLRRRVLGGFVVENTNENRQDCNNAKPYDLAFGQLSIDGVPVFYAGESYKLLNAGGTPPVDSVTTTFSVSEGVLQFSNTILPVDQASFCQDRTAQVYITFASRPPNCDPVSLVAYTVEQCQNGQIVVPSSSSQDMGSSRLSATSSSLVGSSSSPTHTAVSLNHYIRFDGDAEPALKPFIVVALSQCFAVIFVGAAFLANIPFAISTFVVVVDNELSYSSVNSIHLGECRKPHLNRNINAVFGSCFQPPFNYFIYFKPQQQLFTPYDESIQYYPRLFVHDERFLLSKSNNTNLAFITCIEPIDRVQLLHTIKLLRHSDSSANLKSFRDLQIERIAHGKLSVKYGFFACLDILARIKFLACTEFLAHNRFFACFNFLPDDEFFLEHNGFFAHFEFRTLLKLFKHNESAAHTKSSIRHKFYLFIDELNFFIHWTWTNLLRYREHDDQTS